MKKRRFINSKQDIVEYCGYISALLTCFCLTIFFISFVYINDSANSLGLGVLEYVKTVGPTKTETILQNIGGFGTFVFSIAMMVTNYFWHQSHEEQNGSAYQKEDLL